MGRRSHPLTKRVFLVFLRQRVGVPGTSVLLCNVQVLLFSGYCHAIGLTCQTPYSVCETAKGLWKRCLAMAFAIDPMMKAKNSGGVQPRPKQNERRSSRRCKITQLMRIRPSDPERDHFDDIRGTVSMSRTGVYFHSSEQAYQVGMRLF